VSLLPRNEMPAIYMTFILLRPNTGQLFGRRSVTWRAECFADFCGGVAQCLMRLITLPDQPPTEVRGHDVIDRIRSYQFKVVTSRTDHVLEVLHDDEQLGTSCQSASVSSPALIIQVVRGIRSITALKV